MQCRTRNGFAGFRVGVSLLVLLGVGGVDPAAWAQSTSQVTDVSKQAGNTQWTLNCAGQENSAGTDCQVSQIMTLKETGQRILMVVVKKQPETLFPHVLLALPHKIYLPAGIIVQVDTEVPVEMDIETCDERACYASAIVAKPFLGNMKAGTAMHVTFQNLLRKPVTVSVPLEGFTVSYKKLN